MTQQEMEAQALTAAVDILYYMYDREEPNYTTDKIATLMSEAYKAGKAEQKQIDEEQSAKELLYAVDKTAERTRKEVVEKACKWLMEHIGGNVECNDDGEPFVESFIEERKLAMQIVDGFRKDMENDYKEDN